MIPRSIPTAAAPAPVDLLAVRETVVTRGVTACVADGLLAADRGTAAVEAERELDDRRRSLDLDAAVEDNSYLRVDRVWFKAGWLYHGTWNLRADGTVRSLGHVSERCGATAALR